jgi:hypothetical protein
MIKDILIKSGGIEVESPQRRRSEDLQRIAPAASAGQAEQMLIEKLKPIAQKKS